MTRASQDTPSIPEDSRSAMPRERVNYQPIIPMFPAFIKHPLALVALVFLLLIAAWSGLIYIAVKNQVEEVPLSTKEPQAQPDHL